MSKETKDGEDDSPSKEGGEGVSKADDESVSAGVVPELVIGCLGCQGAEAHAKREERLSHSCVPNLKAAKFLPLRRKEEK